MSLETSRLLSRALLHHFQLEASEQRSLQHSFKVLICMMDKTSISKVSIEMSLFAVLEMLKLFVDHASEADFKKEIFHANIFFEMIDLQSFWPIFSTGIYTACADATGLQFSKVVLAFTS